MKHGYLALVALASLGACAVPTGSDEGTNDLSAAITSCPTPTSQDAQQRAAATLALSLMAHAAQVGGPSAPVYSNTILGAQRYRIQSSGVGVEFDPNDPLYPYVSSQMKADLAFAQLDPTVAQFLSDGLNYAYANSDGWYFPNFGSVSVLANFRYPGPSTVNVPNSTATSDVATATGQAWCSASKVVIAETVTKSYQYAPLYALEITNPGITVGGGWLNRPPSAFKGTTHKIWTPFNGNSSAGNPYLIVSLDGTATNWANTDFTKVDSCWNFYPSWQCHGTIEVDPIPYDEPGSYYNATGQLVGTQANPFSLVSTSLYSTLDHQSQWATRTVNGVQEWGTFTTPYTLFGVTMYKYVKQM